MRKLVSFPQVDVNYCLNGKTPIMFIGSSVGCDEACSEVYDVLIKADALNYSKSDELWYDLLFSENKKSVIIRTSNKITNCSCKVINHKATSI